MPPVDCIQRLGPTPGVEEGVGQLALPEVVGPPAYSQEEQVAHINSRLLLSAPKNKIGFFPSILFGSLSTLP